MILSILLVFINVAPSLAQTASTTNDDSERAIVVIYSRPGWWDQVGITYDQQVSRKVALADLTDLSRRAGWTPDGIVITQEKSTANGPVMTSVEFNAKAFDPTTHSFPIEPIVLSFRRFKKIGAVFLIKGYPYWGPLNYQTPSVRMTGESGIGAYTFHFTIFNSNVSHFQIPISNPNEPKMPLRKEPPLLLRFIMVVLIAFVISIIAYVTAVWLNHNRASE